MSIVTYPNVPLLQEDLISNTKNYYPNKTFGFTLGRNNDVNNTDVDLWEGPTALYVFPTTGIQMQVVSTSANDTSAGTGARTVDIHYLNSSYNPAVTTITLNGVTPVLTTPTNILRINGFHVKTVGTGLTSAGNISLQAVGGAVTYNLISLGHNSARSGFYTIPAGKTGYLTHWQGSSGTTTGTHFTRITIRATTFLGEATPGVLIAQDEQGVLDGGITVNYSIPLVFPAQTDIVVRTISDAGAAHAVVMTALFGWIE